MRKQCEACGISFEVKHRDPSRVKYCSPRCRWRLVKRHGQKFESMERICVVCGKTFSSRSRAPQREKFCSKACSAKHWNAIMAKRPRPRTWTPTLRPCVNCGREFTPRRPTQKTCGRSCLQRHRYQQARAQLKKDLGSLSCPECGNVVERTHGRQKFCSHRCAMRAAARTAWVSHPETRRGRTIPSSLRKTVIVRAGRCEVCQRVFTRYEIHHRDWNFRNNTPENLMVLCHRCHEDMDVRCRIEDGVLVLVSRQWRWFPPERIRFEEPPDAP